MKPYFFLIFLLPAVLITLSCKDSITNPEPQPGRRDYVWTVDTIKIPFSTLNKLWGSSPNNIWAIGPGGGLDQTIWHYDGVKWKTDGISRGISPTAIYGLASNNIWIGGYEGKIWHTNGTTFVEKLKYQPSSDWVYSGFKDFCGTSENLYAVGQKGFGSDQKGIIFHYNGSAWTNTNIIGAGDAFIQIKKGNDDPNYYLWSWRGDNIHSDSVRIYSFNGTTLKELHRGLMNDTHGAGMELINGTVYLGIDNAVYIYKNNAFIKQFDVDNPQFTQGLSGRNSKDIFLFMWDGIAHYNGYNVEYIYKTNKQAPRNMLVFEDRIVILSDDFSKGLTFVITGKLK